MSFFIYYLEKKQEKLSLHGCGEKKTTAPGVPRRSPIQVLTWPNVAWLQWSDENWYFQRGMAVAER